MRNIFAKQYSDALGFWHSGHLLHDYPILINWIALVLLLAVLVVVIAVLSSSER
jgi:hypothetical protein